MMEFKWEINNENIDVYRHENGILLFCFNESTSIETMSQSVKAIFEEYSIKTLSYSTRLFSNIRTFDNINKEKTLQILKNYLALGVSFERITYNYDTGKLDISLINA